MVARDIQQFAEIRTKARAYFCFLFSKNLPNRLPEISVEAVTGRLRKIMGDQPDCEGVYLLDDKGTQISPTYLPNNEKLEAAGEVRSTRAYYYRAVKEKRCTITDPYPSLITQELCITASQPIFDEAGVVKYIACLDMPLASVIQLTHPTAANSLFGRISKTAYTLFSLSLAMVSLLLFVKGVESFLSHGIDYRHLEVKTIFEATILLTLSLAIFDLVKTIFEEEVLGIHRKSNSGANRTMIKFMGSIIIALSIEALMLVFKFAMIEPDMLIHAVELIAGVSLLTFTLAIYIKLTKQVQGDDY
ncbi:MAG: hypothetical protein COA44_08170 [Arcobacter sp.]|nr:MAG: hypothetical protein COA44_08170 [Arcobacter sp.]